MRLFRPREPMGDHGSSSLPARFSVDSLVCHGCFLWEKLDRFPVGASGQKKSRPPIARRRLQVGPRTHCPSQLRKLDRLSDDRHQESARAPRL